jgi:hypothetical protein
VRVGSLRFSKRGVWRRLWIQGSCIKLIPVKFWNPVFREARESERSITKN